MNLPPRYAITICLNLQAHIDTPALAHKVSKLAIKLLNNAFIEADIESPLRDCRIVSSVVNRPRKLSAEETSK